jgi:hypothetical protein
MSTTAFVCISHSGDIELKTAFLVYTLKKYVRGDYTINVALPEKSPHHGEPSEESMRYYYQQGIKLYSFQNSVLGNRNELMKGDFNSNKIYALNTHFKEEFILFLDSDTAVLKTFDPNTLAKMNQGLLIKPANRSNISGWKRIYKLAGQTYPSEKIVTSIDKVEIPPYFNAGVIGLNRQIREEFYSVWIKYFNMMREEEDVEKFKIKPFHRDQISLSLAIHDLKLKYSILPEEYNYPLRGKKFKKNEIPIIVHYHRPYTIYSTGLLRKEFNHFLKDHPEFYRLVIHYANWKKFFGTGAVRAFIHGLKESLQYRKFMLTKKLQFRN